MMKKVMKYPIYPIAFSYAGGIFFGLNFRLSFPVAFAVCTIPVLLLFIIGVYARKSAFDYKRNLYFLLCLYFAFASLGYFVFMLHNQPVKIRNPEQQVFTVRVNEVLRSSARNHRFYGTLWASPVPVEVVGYIPATDRVPETGTIYTMVGRIAEIPGKKNPLDFDYRNYLAKKKIYYQVTAQYPVTEAGSHTTLHKKVLDFRHNLTDKFSDLGYGEKVKGFAEALLFGSKTHLDDQLQVQFRDLGILHVLAVSGMHVILLFGTISYALRQLKVPQKIITPLLVLFLIVFSIMAGLSGSVLRAVLMCLMVLLGNYLGARSITLNLLAGSMFLILLFNPNYLFDAGFQLSYLAVYSIVYCYPVVQPYFTFKNRLVNYFSQLTGVSLVAQLGVLPLSIFYFKQVPLLFLAGNIIAVPITSLLLIAWFMQLLLSLVANEAASYFTVALNETALFCFEQLENVSASFTVKVFEVHFDLVQTLLVTAMFFCAFWYFYRKDSYKILMVLTLLLLFQAHGLRKVWMADGSSEFVLMSDTEALVFLHRNGSSVLQWGEGSARVSRSIGNYLLKHNARLVKGGSMENAFELQKESWLIVDSSGVYPPRIFDKVVLSQNAPVNLERLLEQVQPKMVVLHSSNRKYIADAYIDYLTAKKIPYYDMRTKGAYIISYN